MLQSENNKDKEKTYFDFPLSKQKDVGGDLKILYNHEAISQAFKIWISSGQGENVRSTSGGYLKPFLGKGVTVENAERIKNRLIEGLQNDFSPAITVKDIQVIPNPDKGSWLIIISGYNSVLNVGLNTYEILRDRG